MSSPTRAGSTPRSRFAWLAEKYGAEIIAVTLDLGQGRELTDVRERALALGAVRAHVLDAREEFARDYILPALQAGALYEDRYPLATALGRPLIAETLVEVARMEGASAIAHGCTRQGQRPGRASTSRRGRSIPSIKVLAPARMWGMTPRAGDRVRARAPHPGAGDLASPYSVDTNLWGRSIECGVLEDPWAEPPEDIYALTRAPQDCPDEPAYVEIEFEQGVPVRANGIEMPLIELIESLETIAGAHGVGRIDMVENPRSGSSRARSTRRPRPWSSTPRTASSRSSSSRATCERLKHDLGRAYADLVYNGRWFSQTREAIDAFVSAIQPRVTGAVRLKLFKGDCRVVGRTLPVCALRSGAGDLRRRRSRSITAPPKGSSRSGGFRSRPPRARLPITRHRSGADMAHLWSGRFAGDPDAELCSRSAPRSASIAGCSKTTYGAAWRGRRGSSAPACCRRDGRRGDPDGARATSWRSGVSDPAFVTSDAGRRDEDVHAFVERELVARIGDAGRRLHTGRSRNEQVAVDLRLYLKRRIPAAAAAHRAR